MILTPEQLTGKSTAHLTSVLIGKKHFAVNQAVSEDLLTLIKAAQLAGFNFHIASGFRSFEQQLNIWNEKYSGHRTVLDSQNQVLDIFSLSDEDKINAILRWSALPGASRHHWGTDFDVYDHAALPENTRIRLEPWEYFEAHQQPFYQWLITNAPEHGFYFPYHQDLGGVAVEPWHISHITQATSCLNDLSIELLSQQLRDEPLLGKKIVLPQLENIYTRYISNLSPVR